MGDGVLSIFVSMNIEYDMTMFNLPIVCFKRGGEYTTHIMFSFFSNAFFTLQSNDYIM